MCGIAARHGGRYRLHLGQLTRDFGEEVALLVDGCTKLDKVKWRVAVETIRKMVVAMSRDIRVLVIKLADRLHNMRTLHYLRPDKQSRIAAETLEIFAPLAHRLGMTPSNGSWKTLPSARRIRRSTTRSAVRLVAEAAPAATVPVTRHRPGPGRFSRRQDQKRHRAAEALLLDYQKMVVRGRDFQEIYDLVGLRVLVESNRDCPRGARYLHVRWNPVAGTVQGLHRDAEVQHVPVFAHHGSRTRGEAGRVTIRTDDMHRRAEYGVAAHWKYKEGKGGCPVGCR